MKISSKIILIMVSLPVLSMCMELSTPISQPFSDFHKSLVMQLCSDTKETLKLIPQSSETPNTIDKLLCVIESTRDLMSLKITEKQIGAYAYERGIRLQDTLKLMNSPQTSNYHLAVFFKRLEMFNQSPNTTTLPKLAQYMEVMHNTRKKAMYTDAIEQANEFGFNLSPERDIHPDQQPFTTIPDNLAIDSIDTLIKDIKIMCAKDLVTIKALAELLYLNNNNAIEKSTTNITTICDAV